jgi:hypothetical protein
MRIIVEEEEDKKTLIRCECVYIELKHDSVCDEGSVELTIAATA